jgi:hypothetical protein
VTYLQHEIICFSTGYSAWGNKKCGVDIWPDKTLTGCGIKQSHFQSGVEWLRIQFFTNCFCCIFCEKLSAGLFFHKFSSCHFGQEYLLSVHIVAVVCMRVSYVVPDTGFVITGFVISRTV